MSFTEEELLSKHCVDFSPTEDAEKDWALFQQLRAGAIDHYGLEKRPDKKGAKESLCESEERLRLAVQAGTMFAYSWDAATDLIERSGESAQILGVKNDQAVTGAAVSAMVHPDDKQRLEAALTKLVYRQKLDFDC